MTLLDEYGIRIKDNSYRDCKRFVFDREASSKLGAFAVECADLVVKNHHFALPPFEKTYIEIDNTAALAASYSLTEDSVPRARLGFIFVQKEDDIVISCLAGDDDGIEPIPFLYRNRLDPAETESVKRAKRDLFIGQTAPDIHGVIDRAAKDFLNTWSFQLLQKIDESTFRTLMAECRGGLKRALAALLLLNQPNNIRLTGVPHERKIVKGKSKVFMAHSVVSIDLAPKTIRKQFITGLRESPRRHQVRGHFVHYHKVSGCDHNYVEYEAEEIREGLGKPIKRWKCSRCGTLRVFRDAFSRGDGSKGWVSKSYEVTSSTS